MILYTNTPAAYTQVEQWADDILCKDPPESTESLAALMRFMMNIKNHGLGADLLSDKEPGPEFIGTEVFAADDLSTNSQWASRINYMHRIARAVPRIIIGAVMRRHCQLTQREARDILCGNSERAHTLLQIALNSMDKLRKAPQRTLTVRASSVYSSQETMHSNSVVRAIRESYEQEGTVNLYSIYLTPSPLLDRYLRRLTLHARGRILIVSGRLDITTPLHSTTSSDDRPEVVCVSYFYPVPTREEIMDRIDVKSPLKVQGLQGVTMANMIHEADDIFKVLRTLGAFTPQVAYYNHEYRQVPVIKKLLDGE